MESGLPDKGGPLSLCHVTGSRTGEKEDFVGVRVKMSDFVRWHIN